MVGGFEFFLNRIWFCMAISKQLSFRDEEQALKEFSIERWKELKFNSWSEYIKSLILLDKRNLLNNLLNKPKDDEND